MKAKKPSQSQTSQSQRNKIELLWKKDISQYDAKDQEEIIIALLYYCDHLKEEGLESSVFKAGRMFLAILTKFPCLQLERENLPKCLLLMIMLIETRKDEMIVQKACTFLTDVAEQFLSKRVIQRDSKGMKIILHIIERNFWKFPQVNALYTQMKLVHVIATLIQLVADDDKEGVLRNGVANLTKNADLAKKLMHCFRRVVPDYICETSRNILNFYNKFVVKEQRIFSFQLQNTVVSEPNLQIYYPNFIDFNITDLTVSCFITSGDLNHDESEQLLYVELKSYSMRVIRGSRSRLSIDSRSAIIKTLKEKLVNGYRNMQIHPVLAEADKLLFVERVFPFFKAKIKMTKRNPRCIAEKLSESHPAVKRWRDEFESKSLDSQGSNNSQSSLPDEVLPSPNKKRRIEPNMQATRISQLETQRSFPHVFETTVENSTTYDVPVNIGDYNSARITKTINCKRKATIDIRMSQTKEERDAVNSAIERLDADLEIEMPQPYRITEETIITVTYTVALHKRQSLVDEYKERTEQKLTPLQQQIEELEPMQIGCSEEAKENVHNAVDDCRRSSAKLRRKVAHHINILKEVQASKRKLEEVNNENNDSVAKLKQAIAEADDAKRVKLQKTRDDLEAIKIAAEKIDNDTKQSVWNDYLKSSLKSFVHFVKLNKKL